MLNKSLQKEIEGGLPASLYYFWTEESFFFDEALRSLPAAVIGSGPADFNCDVFDTSAEPQAILDAACTLPVMAPRRLVVIKDFHLMTAPALKVLKQYLDNPAETTCLVILSQKPPRTSLKFSGKVFGLNVSEAELPLWLRQWASGKGLRLSSDAVDALTEYVGYDVGMLASEIEKLSLSGLREATAADIASAVSMTRKYSTFDLVDALIAGRKTRAFVILKTLLSENAYEAPVILGTLNWHFRQFYRLWVNRGKRPPKMREGTYRVLKPHLPACTEETFLRIFRALHETDLGIKASGRPAIVLELLLIRLLEKGTRS